MMRGKTAPRRSSARWTCGGRDSNPWTSTGADLESAAVSRLGYPRAHLRVRRCRSKRLWTGRGGPDRTAEAGPARTGGISRPWRCRAGPWSRFASWSGRRGCPRPVTPRTCRTAPSASTGSATSRRTSESRADGLRRRGGPRSPGTPARRAVAGSPGRRRRCGSSRLHSRGTARPLGPRPRPRPHTARTRPYRSPHRRPCAVVARPTARSFGHPSRDRSAGGHRRARRGRDDTRRRYRPASGVQSQAEPERERAAMPHC